MNKSILVQCDEAKIPSSWISKGHSLLKINQFGSNQNLRLQIDNLTHKLLKSLNDNCRDLLDIAAFVYFADSSISRGTNKDVFGKSWSRNFKFAIPVRTPSLWMDKLIVEKLEELLGFLTEDTYEFEFIQSGARTEQLIFKGFEKASPITYKADSVLLFSGGMDALVGTVQAVQDNRYPILVSHQPNTVIANRQRELASLLRQRFPAWSFPHLDLTVNRIGEEAVEFTQRSRSFLFLALGTLVAHELNISELVVAENGITTFNLPRLGQTVGSGATRSTHPKVIALFQELISRVINNEIKIITPLLWKTRVEAIEVLLNCNNQDLLPVTVSCNKARRPKIHPHCGVCSQCIDRRFAVKYLDLEYLESEINGYEKDIFTDKLADGEEALQAVGTVTFATEIHGMSIHSFCEKYVQIFDAIEDLPGRSEEHVRKIYNLYKNYSQQVTKVIGKELETNWIPIIQQRYDSSSLLVRLMSGESQRIEIDLVNQAEKLSNELNSCPYSEGKPYEDVCEKVLRFLFCEALHPEMALKPPKIQLESDQGYERRDMVFPNYATIGFWADIRREYHTEGIIVDAKNYPDGVDKTPVHEIADYLKVGGLGMFAILVTRRLPEDVRKHASRDERLSAAVKAQKDEWHENHKMIVLLDDSDLRTMLNTKSQGKDPTYLLRERIFTLKRRV